MRRLVFGFIGIACLAAPGWAQNDQSGVPTQLPPHPGVVPYTGQVAPAALVNSHILYLNNCRPNGCAMVKGQSDDSRTNTSSIIPHSGTLQALDADTAIRDFASVKTCVSNALAPFGITVTDQDPGNVPHFEMFLAGKPTDVGFSTDFEGVAPYLCSAPGSCGGATYIPNAITFGFGNQIYNASRLTTQQLCGVALQEAAHGWTLDHATPANDPMTYKDYVGTLNFQTNAPCGSDCQYSCPGGGGGACNAFGVQCAGSGTTGTHVCMENNQATQNEVQILTNLFGPASAAAPTVAITTPTMGQTIKSSTNVAISATCTSGDGVKEIDFFVDDQLKANAQASPGSAMIGTLAKGMHTIQVVCGTTKQASASAFVTITIGDDCATAADCPSGDVCSNKECIAGPGAAGGLGAACVNNSDCDSMTCGTDGTTSACVITCDPNASSCPDGFDCLQAGASGVCWASSGGGGGCNAAGDNRGLALFGMFGFGALFIRRRKR